MDVSVVITCWNGRKLLEKNLPSVLAAAGNLKNNIKEIIVVDDGSSDNSVEYITKFKVQSSKFKVKLIKHERNIGYSATCNTGVKEAKGELVAILNLDVIPKVDFLEKALPHFENEKVFSVSFNEGQFGPGKLVWQKGFWEIQPSDIPGKEAETDWPSGGSSVFRKSYWQEIGGMSLIFLPFYFEDIDLGLRARKAGYKCLWEPRARVEHKHESTINSDNFNKKYIENIKQRNHLLLTWRNQPSKGVKNHFCGIIKRTIHQPGYLKIIFMALVRLVVFNFQNEKN